MGFLLFLGVAAIIVVAIVSSQMKRKRQQELGELAGRLGLEYSPTDVFDLPGRYGHIETFNQGHDQEATNLLYGDYRGRNLVGFDYEYVTGSGKDRTVHDLSAVVVQLGTGFPDLVIRPEGILDKVAAAVGFDDIDFESAEFSSKFYVKSRDRKFAYDVCHARMMEWLLGRPGWKFEVCGDLLVVTGNGTFKPEQFEKAMETSVEFLELWPEYLVKQTAQG